MPITSSTYTPPAKREGWNITSGEAAKKLEQMLSKSQAKYTENVLDPLKASVSTLNADSMRVNTLLQEFKALHQAAEALSGIPSAWPLYTFETTASDGAVTISTTSSTDADTLGDLSVSVVALAKVDQINSTVFASNTSQLNLSGNLILNGGTAIAIVTTDTLDDIAAKIKAQSNIDAWVTKVDTNQYVLSLEHPDLCTPIDSTGSGTGIWAGLQLPATTALSSLQANLSVDGVSGIRRSTNTIEDIRPGAKIVLNKISTSPTTGNITENTAWFDEKLTNLVNAYNSCQKALANEQTKESPEKTKDFSNAKLEKYSFFKTLEKAAVMPQPTSLGLKTMGAFGYSFDKDNLLVANTKYTQTLTMADRLKFFTSTCSSSSTNFTQTMPTSFDPDVQNKIRSFTSPITATITHNLDGTYTASLSSSNLGTLSLAYDSTKKIIIGTDDYTGINITYSGADLTAGTSTSATLTFGWGAASELTLALDKTVTTRASAPSIFDQLSEEIKDKKTVTQDDLDRQTEKMKEDARRVREQAGKLEALETHMNFTKNLIKGLVYGTKRRDD